MRLGCIIIKVVMFSVIACQPKSKLKETLTLESLIKCGVEDYYFGRGDEKLLGKLNRMIVDTTGYFQLVISDSINPINGKIEMFYRADYSEEEVVPPKVKSFDICVLDDSLLFHPTSMMLEQEVVKYYHLVKKQATTARVRLLYSIFFDVMGNNGASSKEWELCFSSIRKIRKGFDEIRETLAQSMYGIGFDKLTLQEKRQVLEESRMIIRFNFYYDCGR